MTGYDDLNYPAFAYASQCLRALGFGVVSPAELNPVETAYEDAMRNDIHALADCGYIHLLDGWEKSKGANCEWHIAQVLGLIRIGIDGEPVTVSVSPSSAAEIVAEMAREAESKVAIYKQEDIEAKRGTSILYVRHKGMADALREAERRIRAKKD